MKEVTEVKTDIPTELSDFKNKIWKFTKFQKKSTKIASLQVSHKKKNLLLQQKLPVKSSVVLTEPQTPTNSDTFFRTDLYKSLL